MGEHSGKVWINFKFGAGVGAHFTNIAGWKITEKKRNFFSQESSVVIDHFLFYKSVADIMQIHNI
jgi:hypothetical protein